MSQCYYFGCWNQTGHFLHAPGGSRVNYAHEQSIVLFGDDGRGHQYHLDGTLAPRRHPDTGGICWCAQVKLDSREYQRIQYAPELPQGQFLRHELDSGFTALQWWDRCQGDTRGACNSTLLLKGSHSSAELLNALSTHFPHVLENLQRHQVKLVEVLP